MRFACRGNREAVINDLVNLKAKMFVYFGKRL